MGPVAAVIDFAGMSKLYRKLGHRVPFLRHPTSQIDRRLLVEVIELYPLLQVTVAEDLLGPIGSCLRGDLPSWFLMT